MSCRDLYFGIDAIKHPDYPQGVYLNRDPPWKQLQRIIENHRDNGLPKVTDLHTKAAAAYKKRQYHIKPICYKHMMDLIGNGTYYENRPPWLPARASLESRVRAKCAKLAKPRWTREKHEMFAKEQ
eukprot:gene206-654_t